MPGTGSDEKDAEVAEVDAGAGGTGDPDGQLFDVPRHPTRYDLLLLLVLACIAMPLLLPGEESGVVASLVLQGVTVLVAARISDFPRFGRGVVATVAAAIVVSAAAASIGGLMVDDGRLALLVASRVVSLALALVVPFLIAHDLRRHPAITLQTVAAGLCVYLLLGLAFAFAHGLIDGLAPGSYSRDLGEAEAVYLSYVTLTTVGFGDVTPISGPARTLTVMQAVIGQLYLVSVIALLVGNVGRRRSSPDDDR